MKKLLFAIFTLTMCTLCVVAQTKDEKKAEKLFQKGVSKGGWDNKTNVIYARSTYELSRALPYYEQAAELGHGLAAYRAGNQYYYGRGTNENIKLAVYYWEIALAHKAGIPEKYLGLAANNIGWKCLTDPEVRDYDKAFKYSALSMDYGNNYSFDNLATCYMFGYGCEKNPTKAFNLSNEGLSRGDKLANNNLAYMYYYGMGTNQDYAKAWRCTETVQKELSGVGMFIRANCMLYGNGTSINFDEAHKLYKQSADEGFEPAKHVLEVFYTEKQKVEQRLEEERKAEEAKKQKEAEERKIREAKEAKERAERERVEAIEKAKQQKIDNEKKKHCAGKRILWEEQITYEVPHSGLLEFVLNMNEIIVDVTYEAIVESVLGDESVKCVISNVYISRNGRWNPKWNDYKGAITERIQDKVGKTRVLNFNEFRLK